MNGGIKKFFKGGMLASLGVALLTGAAAAFIVHYYNVLAEYVQESSGKIYALAAEKPVYIPLLVLGAGALAFIGTAAVRFLPDVSGGGIPYVEGVVRGKFSMKWFVMLPAMFVSSLVSFFMGLSLGAEGPSVYIGGAAGCGAARMLRGGKKEQRLFATAGAASGLAVAFNAPLSGLVFSVEEAHRRFSPQIIIPSIVSVAAATVTAKLLFGSSVYLDYGAVSVSFTWGSILGGAFTGVVAGGAGMLFALCVTAKSPLKVRKGAGIFIAAALALIVGLAVPYASGGGKRILSDAGDIAASGVFTVLLIFAAKFLLTTASARSGASGGLFIPMLAIGALTGLLTGTAANALGADVNIAFFAILGAAAFFTAAAHSPFTALVLMLEATRFDIDGLPVVFAAVGISYVLAQALKAKPIYESMLDKIIIRKGAAKEGAMREFILPVGAGSYAENRSIRDLILPDSAVIINISRGEDDFAPDGETVIKSGDTLIVSADIAAREECEAEFKRMFS